MNMDHSQPQIPPLEERKLVINKFRGSKTKTSLKGL